MQNARRGESTSIRCRAVGDQPLSILWFKEKQLIDLKASSRYDHYETRSELGLNSELLIRTTERADGALYTCQAKNDLGEQDRNVKLIVIEVPEPPLDLRVGEVWSKSATITWTAPYNGNSQLNKYVLLVWIGSDEREGKNRKLVEVELKPNSNSHLVKDLTPGTSYAASITAVNDVGSGEPSPPFRFRTGEEEPTGLPTDVHLEAKGSKTVVVSWRAPPRHQWNGNITGYYVQYRAIDAQTPYIKAVPGHHGGVEHETRPYNYLLTGLTKSKIYKISVKAYNAAGAGPPSQELSVATLGADAPSIPSFDGYNTVSKSALRLQWKLVGSDRTDISGFTLYTKRNDLDLYTNILPLPPQQSNFVIQNLEPGIQYSFLISASNNFGESELSEPLIVNLSASPLGITLLLAESNMLLVSAFMISIVSIVVAVLASIIYVKRFKATQEERKF